MMVSYLLKSSGYGHPDAPSHIYPPFIFVGYRRSIIHHGSISSHYYPGGFERQSYCGDGSVMCLLSPTSVAHLALGGANGIGASLVEYCGQQGAYVCFGDVAENAGYQIAQSLCSSGSSSSPRAVFQHTDVTSYQSVLGLFDLALKTYGRIDHVVACAGIMEIGNLFDPALTLETVREVRCRSTD